MMTDDWTQTFPLDSQAIQAPPLEIGTSIPEAIADRLRSRNNTDRVLPAPPELENRMSNPVAPLIATTFGEHPLCQRIILFLLENESAMDTAKGIASCWVDSDEVAVRSALDQLITCGTVTAYTLGSGTLYGLTRNPGMRADLRSVFGRSQKC
jgi:hypothetical protein